MTYLNDLFIGAVNTDSIAVLDYDDSMYGGAETFSGADSDVLLLDGADAHSFDADEGFEAADDADVISASADSDMTFDVSDDNFDADDEADLVGGGHDDDFLFVD